MIVIIVRPFFAQASEGSNEKLFSLACFAHLCGGRPGNKAKLFVTFCEMLEHLMFRFMWAMTANFLPLSQAHLRSFFCTKLRKNWGGSLG